MVSVCDIETNIFIYVQEKLIHLLPVHLLLSIQVVFDLCSIHVLLLKCQPHISFICCVDSIRKTIVLLNEVSSSLWNMVGKRNAHFFR